MKFPSNVTQSGTDESQQIELEVNDELVWFGGHFPGFPVLPGIVQLRWAVDLARRQFKFHGEPVEVLRLKFKSVIVPPRHVRLSLKKVDADSAVFEYFADEQIFSQGKIRFERSGQ